MALKDEVQEVLNGIAQELQEKNMFLTHTSFGENVLKTLIKRLSNFQYSPDKLSLYNYIKNEESDNSVDFYNEILNNYTFIPLFSIAESIHSIDVERMNINYSTLWYSYGIELKKYIKMDVQHVYGQYFDDVIRIIKDFFGEGVSIENIISETYEPIEDIENDVEYWVSLKIDPARYNPWGIINQELISLDDMSRVYTISEEEIKDALVNIVNNKYLPWAIMAQSEFYNWLIGFQDNIFSAPLELNKNLKEGQKEYEMKFKTPNTTNPINFSDIIIRTLPLSSCNCKCVSNISIFRFKQDFENFSLEMLKNQYEILYKKLRGIIL